jgi:hypothetical protein
MSFEAFHSFEIDLHRCCFSNLTHKLSYRRTSLLICTRKVPRNGLERLVNLRVLLRP